jgi:PAS domain S-box-containing protein
MPTCLQAEPIHETAAAESKFADAYRGMFLSAQRGILIIGGETHQVLDVNPAALGILNCPPEQLLGQSLPGIDLFQDLPDLKTVLRQLSDTGAARYDEVLIRRKAGRTAFVDITFHPYLVSNRRVIECNLQVVTSRKRRHRARAAPIP